MLNTIIIVALFCVWIQTRVLKCKTYCLVCCYGVAKCFSGCQEIALQLLGCSRWLLRRSEWYLVYCHVVNYRPKCFCYHLGFFHLFYHSIGENPASWSLSKVTAHSCLERTHTHTHTDWSLILLVWHQTVKHFAVLIEIVIFYSVCWFGLNSA